MKRFISIVIIFLVGLPMFAQVAANISYSSEKGISSLKKNVEFVIDTVAYDQYRAFATVNHMIQSYVVTATQNEKQYKIPVRDIPREITLHPTEDILQNYWFAKNLQSLRTIDEIPDLFKTRADIESDANDYVNALAHAGLIYDDPFLESYLYSLINKIIPNKRADGFPYEVKVVIVKDDSMNACVFPNGMMLINTGLLAELHNEGELYAALCHEMAHFVANHTLVNIRKLEKAQARSEFLAALATAAAAATEIHTARYGYYYGGTLTASTALLSYAVASDILSRMGVIYSLEQEQEADQMAVDALRYLGYDSSAAASLFQRMTDAYNKEGNWSAYYLSGNHPSLKSRIEYTGKPNNKIDHDFERKISFAVTEAAITKFNNGRFSQALKLANQNIDNRVGTDDDYLIKALSELYLFDDNAHNKDILSSIQKAKVLNPNNPNIIRTEIIASLRCNDNKNAYALLNVYLDKLREAIANVKNEDSLHLAFLQKENEWARKMLIKVQGLMDFMTIR